MTLSHRDTNCIGKRFCFPYCRFYYTRKRISTHCSGIH